MKIINMSSWNSNIYLSDLTNATNASYLTKLNFDARGEHKYDAKNIELEFH